MPPPALPSPILLPRPSAPLPPLDAGMVNVTGGFDERTPAGIKDLKAANPLEGLSLMQPTTDNNRGTANLSYPIEIPDGRQGMQPNLALTYSSGGVTHNIARWALTESVDPNGNSVRNYYGIIAQRSFNLKR